MVGGAAQGGTIMAELSTGASLATPSRRALIDRIERLNMPADAKVLLARMIDVTAETAGRLVEVGRRVIAFAFELVKSFPNTTFGTIIALLLSAIVGSVPIIGGLLAAFVAPWLLIFGISAGALADIKDGALRRRVQHLEDEFRAIAA
jgi:hypothetical protein